MPKKQQIENIINEQYRKNEYNTFCTKEYMVEMSDGVKLRAVVAFPEGGRLPMPIILTRSPYGEKSLRFFYEMSLYGYICVYQDCRGCGGSQGEWEPYIHERQDGLDTLNWIIKQKWCDGNIGLTGESYLSMVQWLMADTLPKEVKTLNIEVFNPYRHMQLYSQGMFKLEAYTGWTAYNTKSPLDITKQELYQKAINFTPQINMDKALFGTELDWYREWILNPDENSWCWNEGVWGILKHMPPKLNVPTLFRGGWYDPHIEGMIKAYKNLSQKIRDESIFIITPLNHRGTLSSDLDLEGIYEFVGTRFIKTKLMWFDYHLKSMELNGFLKKGFVYAYILGENRWQEFSGLPEINKHFKLYMDFENRTLSKIIPENGEAKYKYDPYNAVKTIGSDVLMTQYMYQQNPEPIHGIRLQPPKNYRNDVISLESHVLERDMTILGKVKVRLFVSTDSEDTAFAVKLCHVLPNGNAYNIRNGITSLKHNLLTQSKNIKNEVNEIEIQLPDIFVKLNKGEKIRLDISSSDFPGFNIHPNTDRIWSEAEILNPVEQRVYSGKINTSYLEFPIYESYDYVCK